MTPEQLSQIIADALRGSRRPRCDRRCADGAPSQVRGRTSEDQGARRLRHQHRAAAGQAGRYPAARARRAARDRAARPTTASPRSTSPARASSTSRSRPLHRARWRGSIVEAGAAYGGSDRSPAQRINLEFVSRQPDRPGPHRRRALGTGRRQPGPGLRRRSAPTSRGSTTSTTTARRSTASSRSLSRRRARTGRIPRTGTSATTSPTSRTRWSRPTPTCWSCPTTRRRRCSVATAST